jgi:hypothetical protein
MSTRALIGFTGFVGQNLMTSGRWDATFNRANLHTLPGQEFDLLVCAGLPAEKWRANLDPLADRLNMLRLADALDSVRTRRFVLISTVDVYADPTNVDELTPIEPDGNHAYGKHRREFELLMLARFDACHTLRLPAVFGPQLKKNVLFDLMSANCLDAIQPESRFQWYPITRLHQDIDRAIKAELPCVNLVTQPLPTGKIISEFFPEMKVGWAAAAAVSYQAKTRYATVFGGGADYIMTADAVIEAMRADLSENVSQWPV